PAFSRARHGCGQGRGAESADSAWREARRPHAFARHLHEDGTLRTHGVHGDPNGTLRSARDARCDCGHEHRDSRAADVTVARIQDVQFGEELPVFAPDTTLPNVKRFAVAAGWNRPRLTPH